MNLNRDQIRTYFAARFPKDHLPATAQVSLRCPFHQDKTASMSVNLEKGVFRCHAGCGSGGLVDFEMEMSHCDRDTAWANICELIGIQQKNIFKAKPEAVYQYHDADGRLLFEKLRYPGKDFRQRRPDGKGGWEYSLATIAKPLYHLPEVITAEVVFVCEGEKDADNVRALGISTPDHPSAATTNFDGASHWREEYAPYFTGKKAVIFPDNDKIGKEHAEAVARSVSRYANSVKVVHLPGLLEKQDVSDYLTIHTREDLIAEIKNAPRWIPSGEIEQCAVVSGDELQRESHDEIEWLVDGVVQAGANGLICAIPKAGKSWAAADLCIAMSMGMPWMGQSVSHPVKTALIAREDAPKTTAWRTRQLSLSYESKGGDYELYCRNFWVSTKRQQSVFLLDDPPTVAKLCRDLKAKQIEFLVFDVFNVLHHADENDNTEMRKVLEKLNDIQQDVGCSIGLVHHFNKQVSGPLISRMRGSSAIAGWAEWHIAVSIADEETDTRKFEFDGKAAAGLDPMYFRIAKDQTSGYTHLSRCNSVSSVPNAAAQIIARARARKPH